MKDLKWYEKLQRQCPKCHRYLAIEIIKETRDYYDKECKFCHFKVKHERPWAMYKHKNGKVYLKSNKFKKYTEVKLERGLGYIKIVPANQLINKQLI